MDDGSTLPPTTKGNDAICQEQIRAVLAEPIWRKQMVLWWRRHNQHIH